MVGKATPKRNGVQLVEGAPNTHKVISFRNINTMIFVNLAYLAAL